MGPRLLLLLLLYLLQRCHCSYCYFDCVPQQRLESDHVEPLNVTSCVGADAVVVGVADAVAEVAFAIVVIVVVDLVLVYQYRLLNDWLASIHQCCVLMSLDRWGWPLIAVHSYRDCGSAERLPCR